MSWKSVRYPYGGDNGVYLMMNGGPLKALRIVRVLELRPFVVSREFE